MRLGGANGDGVCPFHAEVAHCQSSAPRNIKEHQLIVGFCGHAAGVFGLRRRESNNFESWLFVGLGQFEVFYFWVSVFEAVEVEKQKVLIFNFFADGDMVASGTDGDALDGFYVVWQFDKLHGFIIEILFYDGFSYGIDHFHACVFFDDSDFVFGLECEVGSEGVVEV